MSTLRAVHHRPTILIAGAGVAGLEALLGLRSQLGGSVHIELLAPDGEFVYRPTAVAEPFGIGEVHRIDLAQIAADQHAAYRRGALEAVIGDQSIALTTTNESLEYDYLLVCAGARQRRLIEDAITFDDEHGRADFRRMLDAAETGEVSHVSFVVPPETAWVMPLYELALLTAWWARKRDLGLTLSFCSPESRPLEAFGGRASTVVGRLLREGGIEFVDSAHAAPGSDAVVSIPVPEGRFVTGLPCDDRGFIPTDRYGAVPGVPRVWAAGDGTDFPIKQGGLAAQQADAAAAAIARELGTGTEPEPFRPVLRGLLLTGDLPRYLRSDGGVSEVGVGPLWWPPSKIAAQFLAPYLAGSPLARVPLSDRSAPDDLESSEQVAQDEHDAVDLLLALADANATRGSYSFAVRCLEGAEAVAGPLPAKRQEDRRAWLRHASQ